MVVVMWFILEKTTRGYELKAVGFNKNAADYAGMSVNKNIILAMTISGMFAGLGGAMEALGTFQNASIKPGFTGIGFDGTRAFREYPTDGRKNQRCRIKNR